jgi:nitrogen regulatory protein PII
MSKYAYEVIFCIVNAGYSEEVMDASRELGCRGGTVIRARGTANPESEKLFNIPIQPEKEIVMMVVKSSIKNEILHALYKAVGLNTPGQGIAFSMPVDEVVGLAPEVAEEIKSEADAEK